MFTDGLSSLLSGDPGIAAIVGTSRKDGTNGVFPNVAPDEVLIPYIVYTQTARGVILSFDGVNQLQSLRFQIACYGTPYRAVKNLAQAVKKVLDGYTGQLTDGSIIDNVIPNAEHDEMEPIFKATMYGVILDYSFSVIEYLG